MTRYWVLTLTTIVGLLAAVSFVSVRGTAQAQKISVKTFETPVIFQAAGPNAASIQSTVDAFRAELGANNGNGGPQPTGRREINWDGAPGTDATTTPVTPFNVFLNTRGAQFQTPGGTGLSQAPPSGGAQGGLATLFNNPTYGNTFKTFSPLRLFTPVSTNVTTVYFFQPGSNGGTLATTRAFGAVFVDVDHPNGVNKQTPSTKLEVFGLNGQLVFSSFVPSSPGDGNLSFFGVNFKDTDIGFVRITTGNTAPGPDDGDQIDVVMMDDFIYGEPRVFPQPN